MSSLRITYKKSIIGYSHDQKATVRSLGLRKLNQVVVLPDRPSLRGMLFKVRHLVTFEEVDDVVAPPADQSLAPQMVPIADQSLALQEVDDVVAPPADQSLAPQVVASDADQSLAPQAITSGTDDIALIEGIGPKIAQVLQEAGISTFAQLAVADSSELRAILQQQPQLRLADPTTWPEQARLAAAGQWDEFKQLTDQLRGGRHVS